MCVYIYTCIYVAYMVHIIHGIEYIVCLLKRQGSYTQWFLESPLCLALEGSLCLCWSLGPLKRKAACLRIVVEPSRIGSGPEHIIEIFEYTIPASP